MELSGKRIRKDISGWVTFEGLFDVRVHYMPRFELQKALKRCKKMVFIRHQREEEIDEERLLAFLAGLIGDWRGLTYRMIAEHLVPIEVEEGKEDDPVPCTEANKVFMLKHAYGFDVFIQEAAMDLDLLVAQAREAERKNSRPTSGGSSPPDGSTATRAGRSMKS